MVSALIRRRKARARILIWLVRAGAALSIGTIGLLHFVWGDGLSPGLFSLSNANTDLKIQQGENGRFELSLAVQPPALRPKAAESALPVERQPAHALRADPADRGSSSQAPSVLSALGVEERREVGACAIGGEDAKSSNEGRLLRASFAVGGVRIDGYGLNDLEIPPVAPHVASGTSLPALRWIRAQGALAGFDSTSAGPRPRALPLPNFLTTANAGMATDFTMSVAHDAVDFLSVGLNDYASELNVWYHSLDAGFRTRIVGAMDCEQIIPPALNGARSNIKAVSISANRRLMRSRDLYVSDGHAVISDFRVNGRQPASEFGAEVSLPASRSVAVIATLSARLTPQSAIAAPDRTPGWNIERARVPGTQLVAVEIVVNGRVAASKSVLADGTPQTVSFDIPIRQSSWVALRLMGAAHTNPVFVLVDKLPVRASRASVEWNMRSLLESYEAASADQGQNDDSGTRAAYRYAYAVYEKILSETSAP